MQLLRRKAWQVSDLDRHPVCLGVPLGQDGGDAKAVSVDCGLKTMASVSLGDLVDSSPELKEALMEHGLQNPQSSEPIPHTEHLRRAQPVPMVVAVKEDLMKQPVAAPTHPASLERSVPDEKLRMLNDSFFRANPPSSELVDLVVEAVPGADKYVEARDNYRREQRSALHSERNAMSGKGS